MENPDCPGSSDPPNPVAGPPASLAGPTGVPVTIGAQRGALKFSTAEVEENLKSLDQLDLETVTATTLDYLLHHHLSGGLKILSDQRQLNQDRREQQGFFLLCVRKGALSAAHFLLVVLRSVKLKITTLKMQDLNMLPEFHTPGVTMKTFGF